MKAIKAGIITPITKAELEAAEARKAGIQRELEANPSEPVQIARFLPGSRDTYRSLVAPRGDPEA